MTPKTQSVCDKLRELSQRYRQAKEYNNSGDDFGNGYANGKEDAYTNVADELDDLLAEPVAKSASTGEQSIWPVCDWCGTELDKQPSGAGKCPKCGAMKFGAARPSEPSSFEGIPKGIANTLPGPQPAAPQPVPASQTPQSVIEAATELLDAMETCHVCKGMIFLQEYTVHCEDCPSDCENHEGQECAPIYDLHAKLRKLLKLATPASTARTDGWVSVEDRLPTATGVYGIYPPEQIDKDQGLNFSPRYFFANEERNTYVGKKLAYGWVKVKDHTVTHWRELPAAPGSVPK